MLVPSRGTDKEEQGMQLHWATSLRDHKLSLTLVTKIVKTLVCRNNQNHHVIYHWGGDFVQNTMKQTGVNYLYSIKSYSRITRKGNDNRAAGHAVTSVQGHHLAPCTGLHFHQRRHWYPESCGEQHPCRHTRDLAAHSGERPSGDRPRYALLCPCGNGPPSETRGSSGRTCPDSATRACSEARPAAPASVCAAASPKCGQLTREFRGAPPRARRPRSALTS